MVNTSGEAQKVKIDLKGARKVSSKGLVITLKADKPEDTNSITDPENIIPVIANLKGVKRRFDYVFPAYSITVLQIETMR